VVEEQVGDLAHERAVPQPYEVEPQNQAGALNP
jgi:hypothetical protein